jgi:hypothetical protein
MRTFEWCGPRDVDFGAPTGMPSGPFWELYRGHQALGQ